ncbi:MAG: Ig-like domain-containing protein [Trueperaceae bacterium]|nr:Ig-like domain-containing protein [Trueperaceae bacterium]
MDTRSLGEGVAHITFEAFDGLGRAAQPVDTWVRIDRTPPTAVVEAPPQASGRFPVVVAFSEPVQALRARHLDVDGGVATHVDGDGAVYVVDVVPDRNADDVRVAVDVGVVRDAAGHANARSDVVTVVHDPPRWTRLVDGVPTRWVARAALR